MHSLHHRALAFKQRFVYYRSAFPGDGRLMALGYGLKHAGIRI